MSDDNQNSEVTPAKTAEVKEGGEQSPGVETVFEPTSSLVQQAPEKPVGELIEALQKLPKLEIRELDYKNMNTEPEELSSLLGASDSPVPVGKDPLVIHIRERAFVSCVEIQGNKAFAENVRVEYLSTNEQWRVARVVTSRNAISVEIAENAKALRVSRTGSFRSITVNRVNIYGFSGFDGSEWQENFEIFIDQVETCEKEFRRQTSEISLAAKKVEDERLSNQQSLQHEREVLENEKINWITKIDVLKVEQSNIQTVIDTKRAEQAEAVSTAANIASQLIIESAKLADVTTKKDEFEKRHSELEKLVTEKVSGNQSLDSKIADKKIELEALNNDASLFATNLKGYGAQGTRQARTYLALIGVTLGLGIWATYVAFSEVNKIWNTIVADPTGITWSLIAITRFSIFVIFSAVIGALSALVFAFVRRTIEIHDRSLRLSEISILAKDVIDATLLDKGATPEQRVTVFYSTRMTLIRNLLSGTFEKLSKTSKAEKEELIADLKSTDSQSFSNALLEALIDLAKTKKKVE